MNKFKVGDMVCVKDDTRLYRNVYGEIMKINDHGLIEVWETDGLEITDTYRYETTKNFIPIRKVDDFLGFFSRFDGEVVLSDYVPGPVLDLVMKHGLKRTFKKLLILAGEKDRGGDFIGKWYEDWYNDVYGNEKYNEWIERE